MCGNRKRQSSKQAHGGYISLDQLQTPLFAASLLFCHLYCGHLPLIFDHKTTIFQAMAPFGSANNTRVIRMNNQYRTTSGAPTMDMSTDQGLRTYMLGIYNHMVVAMGITGAVAFFASQSQQLMQLLYSTPLRWVVMFAPLAFVFYLSARIYKMSPSAARIAFYLFSATMGLSISFIFLVYTGMSIATIFFMTAAMFGSLSLWGYTTKKDISGWGGFLFMGLIGVIIASVVNLFLHSSMMEFAISVIGLLVFAGLTAYDTQKLKHSYYAIGGDAAMAARMSIMGALNLYLDFLNMFLFMLRLFGGRN
jgi:FtsH-binding integral membrane protein